MTVHGRPAGKSGHLPILPAHFCFEQPIHAGYTRQCLAYALGSLYP